jgi:hypothetical protein
VHNKSHEKSYAPRKAKTTYILKWMEYLTRRYLIKLKDTELEDTNVLSMINLMWINVVANNFCF